VRVEGFILLRPDGCHCGLTRRGWGELIRLATGAALITGLRRHPWIYFGGYNDTVLAVEVAAADAEPLAAALTDRATELVESIGEGEDWDYSK
jgi:hypothetical protein